MAPVFRKRLVVSKILPVAVVFILFLLLFLQLHNASSNILGTDVLQVRNKLGFILDKPGAVAEKTGKKVEINDEEEDTRCKNQFGVSWFYSVEKNKCLFCEEICADLEKMKENLDPCVKACQIYSVLQIARKEVATVKSEILAAVLETDTTDKGLKETLIEGKFSKLEEADETANERWRELKGHLEDLNSKNNDVKNYLSLRMQKLTEHGEKRSQNLEEAIMVLHGTIAKAFILMGVGFVVLMLTILFVVLFMDKIAPVVRNLKN